jgi:hypothetical protein
VPGLLIGIFFSLSLLSGLFVNLKELLTPTESKLMGVWESSGVVLPKAIVGLSHEMKSPTINGSVSILNFYEDPTCSILFLDTMYVSGTWKYLSDEKAIQLDDRGRLTKWFVSSMSSKELTISLSGKDSYALGMAELGVVFKKNDKSVFHAEVYKPEHNKWRIRPAKAETDQQIKSRVAGFISYMERFYDLAVEYDMNVVNNEQVSPFILASNGIGIKNEYPEWSRIFYSQVDAEKGYKLLVQAVPKSMDFSEGNIFIRNRLVAMAF